LYLNYINPGLANW